MPDIAPMHLPVSAKGSTISASVLHGPRDLRLEARVIEDPGVGELQIAVKSTGICGSDVSYYKKFANGDLCACAPLSLGHESSGVVVAIGPLVSGFQVGDRVALEVGIPCGQCTTCRKGRLPDHVSFDAAALLEPLSVAIHAVNRASPTPGSTALVVGAGTVGLLTAAMARQSGCTTVTITDIDAGRVGYALKKGFATHGYVVPHPLHTSSSSSSIFTNSGASTPLDSGVVTPSSMFSNSIHGQLEGAKSLAADILSLTSPPPILQSEDEDDGVDVTFECTGKEVCMHTSLYATRPGGKVIMVGMGTPIQTLPMSVAHLREVDILGIFRYANTYSTGIRLLCGGSLPSLDDMVTHRFKGLGAAKRAFELAGRTVDDDGNLVLKVIIEA
ncbi:hypothetical protein DL764_000745 [Monosporascus ibericus]|uniref:Enoyl reductase (ER) domain-containing protein n=1 Tax=Monosporascus ibericus TaxID=155417 RepID=A0A4Q4TXB1_9PEZI|nr:hypothetical protein DL764_000745 [Monosporascus ibericus]